MNKKLLSSAMVLLTMATCALNSNALPPTNLSFPTRSVNVSGTIGGKTISVIDTTKYYQIQVVNPKDMTYKPYLTMGHTAQGDSKENGRYQISAQFTSGTNLNESLWKISIKKEGVAGYIYTLTNKASGLQLSFNDAELEDDPDKICYIKSDMNEWQWYSDPESPTELGFVPFYTYSHDGNSVFGYSAKDVQQPSGSGYPIGSLAIEKVAKSEFQDRDAGGKFLMMRVVEAAPRVLNADEFNSMIDASNQSDGVRFKSVPKVSNELFSAKVKAVQVNADALAANYKGFANFLVNEAGNYFRVDPDSTYDYGTLPITNGGFKVGFAKLQGLKIDDKHAAVDTVAAKVTATVDPLIARYLWRATYWATEDSLVLEPLNASSVSSFDKQSGKTWIESGLTTATINNYYNTVNEGVAHASGVLTLTTTGSGPLASNVNFNKAASAAVALTIYNQGNASYDGSSVLTIGTALNVVKYVEYQEHKGNYDPTRGTVGIKDANVNYAYVADMGIKITFDSQYNYFTRATLPTGLYFIQLASKSNNDLFRKAGKYIVANHRGDLMYDSPTSFQNYNKMPATQWVIMQDSCNVNGGTPEVRIYNREYGNILFEGQLHIDSNNNYYVINEYLCNGTVDNAGMIKQVLRSESKSSYGYPLSYQDTLAITPVTDKAAYTTDNGYQLIDSASAVYNEYNLKYLTANLYGNTTTDQYLSLANDSILGINATPNLAFQLVPVYAKDSLNEYGPVTSGRINDRPWKYNTSIAKIQPLTRQAYILKVRDNNLIDNGWKYVAFHQDVVNQNPYYKMENLKDIDGQNNKLAVFYLKNDQYVTADSTNAFALIDANGLQYQKITSLPGNKVVYDPTYYNITTDFTSATETNQRNSVNEILKFKNPYDSFIPNYTDSTTTMYNPKNPNGYFLANRYVRSYAANGWYRLAVEDQNAMSTIATLDNAPGTRVSAFVLAPVAREIYMPLTDKGVLAGNNIKIYRERGINGATKEYIYEDGNNATHVAEGAYIKGFNYLGITGENIAPVGKDKTVAFYVDSVLHSQKVMPQYLLYVDRDTIAAGEWCNTGEHGYNAAGDSKTHQIVYNALSYGRVLVNLNDSVKAYANTSVNKLENGLKYAFENYTRLGFVPAIHINIGAKDDSSAFSFLGEGEWLVVLNNTTFDNVMSTVGSTKVINPSALDSAIHNGLATVNPLDGNHQNYAFSFRYTDDTHVPFLMESKGYGHVGFPGTYTDASWVKIQDGVPVIAQDVQPSNNGEHTSIAASRTLQEVINQAQILKLETTNEIATANESLAAANVQVIAGNGVVTVKNAAGKKLVITNILGKVIANTVVTSDNATFAAPAGIVAVAVEGEPAVKAIVK